MQIDWNDKDPIYRQLRDRIVELILDGVFSDGDPLPSVRQIASEHRINPLTVSKAFQLLVDDQLVEKKRGLGMFVGEGAGAKLAALEKDRFLNQEWPTIAGKISRLGLDPRLLLAQLENDE
jgi:GntR family transcriptional regulator|tara:strand:+ start:1148 stop:1510 length:363 start_codon:yes stop_codon:yes gene_type:complete